jgi:hypothetical protein
MRVAGLTIKEFSALRFRVAQASPPVQVGLEVCFIKFLVEGVRPREVRFGGADPGLFPPWVEEKGGKVKSLRGAELLFRRWSQCHLALYI